MKEQEYILKNIKTFEPKHIFECGQCFRWIVQKDGSYTGIVRNNVLNVKKENNNIIIKSYGNENLEELCNEYFGLKTDYEKIQKELLTKDSDMEEAISFGKGIRILKQDPWETTISYIISANNMIPRIMKSVELISQKYGKEIIWNNKKYYTFPTPEELSKATIQDLRLCGVGFRDKYIYEAVRKILLKEIKLNELQNIDDINLLRKELCKIKGVGDKVADCIMLFSMSKMQVFPVDVWVRRIMNEMYIKSEDEKKVNKKIIRELAKEKYANNAGIAQQYLFYWRRENSK